MRKIKTVKNLAKYVFKYKYAFVGALLLTVVGDFLALLGPSLLGNAIDAIGVSAGNVDFDALYYYVFQMITVYVISFGMSYVSQNILVRVSQKIAFNMRKDVFDHLQLMKINYFDTHQTGDTISRISYDIDTINTSLSSDLISIVSGAVTVVISIIMMIQISLPLVSITFATLIFMIFFARYRMKKVKPLFTRRSVKLGQLNGYAEDILVGHKTIKSYGKEEYFFDMFSAYNREAGHAYYQADYQGGIMGPSVSFVNNITLALISVFGALLYLSGQMSIGNISSYVLYSRKFSGPLNEISNIVSELQSSISAAERVFSLLNQPIEPADAVDAFELNQVEGRVEFDDVSFAYVPGIDVLKRLSLSVEPGQQIAIVGPTGSGKTTIINLLMRFYDVDKGEIRIDGHPIQSIIRKSLRQSMTMILQDSWVFNGTILENVAYAHENATLEDVVEACKKAYIHDYIMSLPDGYHTRLQEEALSISNGQKQLLAIARVFLSEAKILILDEATSNVDTQTESLIQKAMQEIMKNKTCFIIAHRLSTIRNADTILVIKDGLIVENGNHDTLMEQQKFYHQLYSSQFDQ